MTNYIKIENGVVVQKQRSSQAGFVLAHNSVGNGMTFIGGDYMDINNYTTPSPPPPTNDEIYDEVMQGQAILKALAQVCADQFGITGVEMKALVKAKM